jgi:hypothetical protein
LRLRTEFGAREQPGKKGKKDELIGREVSHLREREFRSRFLSLFPSLGEQGGQGLELVSQKNG